MRTLARNFVVPKIYIAAPGIECSRDFALGATGEREHFQQRHGTIGFSRISASALIAASPTRSPVNEPGPETTMKASISALLRRCLSSKAAICGTSCAENMPPARKRDFDHLDLVPIGFARARQRDVALLAGSVGDEKKHWFFPSVTDP